MKNKCLFFSLFCTEMFPLYVFFMQVHELDEQTWRTVEVVPIDIASKEEVAPGVSLDYGWCLMKTSYKPHIKK